MSNMLGVSKPRYEAWINATCCICGESFTAKEFKNPDAVHTPHEPDCPNFRTTLHVNCECDHYAHAECCPECHPNPKWA